MKIPCEECISLAICKYKYKINCDILMTWYSRYDTKFQDIKRFFDENKFRAYEISDELESSGHILYGKVKQMQDLKRTGK
jgi:hypothetical protein